MNKKEIDNACRQCVDAAAVLEGATAPGAADVFPPMILALPEADIPIHGIHAWLAQEESRQFIFMKFDEDAVLPTHSHAAQWGFVLEGSLTLTIGDRTAEYRRGDRYDIPAGTPHGGFIRAGLHVLDCFDQPDRYPVRRLVL